MNRIIVAKHASFCPGVRRAVTLLEQAAESGGDGIYCLGELIHNPAVTEMVSRRGIKTSNLTIG